MSVDKARNTGELGLEGTCVKGAAKEWRCCRTEAVAEWRIDLALPLSSKEAPRCLNGLTRLK